MNYCSATKSDPEFLTCVNAASFWYPDFVGSSAWLDHLPFAFYLTSVLRPRTFVELGTHGGCSYFAFCQAVKALGLETRCYAIDSWKGDEHAGFYGAEVFECVRQFNDRHYAAFSRLVRSTFDDARSNFPDASVDLLHIDGRHFYEDVKYDFESWRPKLSENSVVLFHDTNVRERSFGVSRLWSELTVNFPAFEFLHGHGLGVLGYGSNLPDEIAALLAVTDHPNVAAQVRQAYARLGAALKADFEASEAHSQLTARLSGEEARAGELKAKLATREAEATDLAYKLKAQEARVGDLNAKLEKLDTEATDLASKLNGQGALVGDLTAKLTARDRVIQELKSSTSWRITKPLRAISLKRAIVFDTIREQRRAEISVLKNSMSWLPQRMREGTRQLAWMLRGILKLIWWTITLQLYRQLIDRRRLRRQCNLVRGSNLFDAGWYLATFPDVARAQIDPVLHYLLHGAAEGRSPSAFFDGAAYLARYPDVAAAKMNPLVHYLQFGRSEDRQIFGRVEGSHLKDSDETGRRRFFGTTEAENFNWYLTPDTELDRRDLNIVYLSGEPNKPGETYRVLNYVEALRNVNNVRTYWLRSRDLANNTTQLKSADLLIIYRHRYTEELAELVLSRRSEGKCTVYDIDDMMIEPNLANSNYIDAIRFNSLDAKTVRENYLAHREMLLLCDAGFASTSPLAETMRRLGKRSFVIPNGFGSAHLKHSLMARSEVCRNTATSLRIGYSSGSRTHQKDFGRIASPLAAVMRKFDHVLLTTFGATLDFAEFRQFDDLRDRIETRSLTQLDYLPYEIARFDINIAPLEVGNPFCECKSQLKYYESALVGVPTIASPTVPFTEAITNGVNGLLADSEEEWMNCLEQLICQPAYRLFLAQNAIHMTYSQFGLEAQAKAMGNAIRELLQRETDHDMKVANNFGPIQLAPNKPIATSWGERVGKVAVIIPLFNYAWCIEECLNSVKSQTIAAELDLIVVDDCSSDPSADVALHWLKSYGMEFNGWALFKHQANFGLARARNTGVANCQSSYYFPLDADNKLDPVCIARCLEKMSRGDGHKTLGAVYPSRVLFGDVTVLFKKTNERLQVGGWDPERLAKGNYIDAMALIRKSAWRRVGGYTDVIERGGWQDYDFWCKFVECGLHGEYESSAIAFYRTHRNSMLHTRTHVSDVYAELVERMKEKHPWLRLNGRN